MKLKSMNQKTVIAILGIAIGLFSFGLTSGQNRIVIDLSEGDGATNTFSISPGKNYEIIIKNRIPGETYEVNAVVEQLEVAKLQLPVGQGQPETQNTTEEATQFRNDICNAITQLCDYILSEDDESNLAILYPQLQALVKSYRDELRDENRRRNRQVNNQKDGGTTGEVVPVAGCSDVLARADGIISQAEYNIGHQFDIFSGEKLTVTITRVDSDGKRHIWKSVYNTPAKVNYIVTYGYLAISNEWFNMERTYYLNPGDNSTYTIMRSNAVKRIGSATAVMFSYIPARYQGYCFRPVVGLGTNASQLLVVAGGQLTIHSNIALSTGVVLHNQKILNGKYRGGDVISENLTDDQLHDTRLATNLYFGIHFRFNENPTSRNPQQ